MQVGALVDWQPEPLFTAAEAANIDRVSQFAIGAAGQALKTSGLDLASVDRNRIGVFWGTGMGGAHTLDASFKGLYSKGEWRTRPLTVVMAMNNASGSNVAVRYGLRGPFANFSTACSSSAMALGEAMQTILAGRADAIVAGGARRCSRRARSPPGSRWHAPADPADAAGLKPFDKRRRTGAGEGAAAFVLEDGRRTQARARVSSPRYGNTYDAGTHVPPDPRRPGARDEAGVRNLGVPCERSAVGAHGTTSVGDGRAEAVNEVFGGAACR